MKNVHATISIILRLMVGISLMMDGLLRYNSAQQLQLPDIPFGNTTLFLYASLFQVAVGIFLLLGVLTSYVALLAIAFVVYNLVTAKLFLINPFTTLLQKNQVIAQIFLLVALYKNGAASLSFDHFFFPFKLAKKVGKKLHNQSKSLLRMSLASTLGLTFVSVFLFIDKSNYLLYEQWKNLIEYIPFLNLPIVAGVLSVAAVLLILGYASKSIGFATAILYLLAVVTNSHAIAIEILPCLGAAIALAIWPNEEIVAIKVVPRRQLSEL